MTFEEQAAEVAAGVPVEKMRQMVVNMLCRFHQGYLEDEEVEPDKWEERTEWIDFDENAWSDCAGSLESCMDELTRTLGLNIQEIMSKYND